MQMLHAMVGRYLRRSAPLIQALYQGVLPKRQAPTTRFFATLNSLDGSKRINRGSSRLSSITAASLQRWSTPTRHFSSSPVAAHGHLTPPKPGEE